MSTCSYDVFLRQAREVVEDYILDRGNIRSEGNLIVVDVAYDRDRLERLRTRLLQELPPYIRKNIKLRVRKFVRSINFRYELAIIIP